MSITVEVSLLSGKTAIVQAGQNETVKTLTKRAQIALGVGRGRLLDSAGGVLDASMRISTVRVQNGDTLTFHINSVQIQASSGAFAAILGDGSVVTWGPAACGGDSSAVQAQLKNVQQIQASASAFAAIREDGSVVTWGHAFSGGDSSAVQGELKHVQQIQAVGGAFAAILDCGSVVTWGPACGGDSSAVQAQLKNVQQIQASSGAFAAILGDGSVVTWGDADRGGDCSSVQGQLKTVQQIQASDGAFAAILGDESVVTWGPARYGGDSSAVQGALKNVQQIQASYRAFAAILGDGSVVTWGDPTRGGDSSAVQDRLKNVQQIQAAHRAFAAILGDGSVVTWGDADCGGDSGAVQGQLKNVQQIQARGGAFAAILGSGAVVTWGPDSGGDAGAVEDQLKNVQQIQARGGAFAAILGDGSVVTWGDADPGGDSSAVQGQLKAVQQIQALGGAFAAILGDGSVALRAMLSWRLPATAPPPLPSALLAFSFDATPQCHSLQDCPFPGPSNELLAATVEHVWNTSERVEVYAQWEIAAALLRSGRIPPGRIHPAGVPGRYMNTVQILEAMMQDILQRQPASQSLVVLAHPDHLRRAVRTLQTFLGSKARTFPAWAVVPAMAPYSLDWPSNRSCGSALDLYSGVSAVVHSQGSEFLTSWRARNLGYFPDGDPQIWVRSREVWVLYDHWAMAKGIATGIINVNPKP
eukprot:s1829_g6.t2